MRLMRVRNRKQDKILIILVLGTSHKVGYFVLQLCPYIMLTFERSLLPHFVDFFIIIFAYSLVKHLKFRFSAYACAILTLLIVSIIGILSLSKSEKENRVSILIGATSAFSIMVGDRKSVLNGRKGAQFILIIFCYF